jgi:hypothetical protein
VKRALLAVAAVVACKGADGEYSGLGHWRFGVSTLKDASSGRCTAAKLSDGRDATWCLGLKTMKIGQRSADVELYFLGSTPDAPLIEIYMQVRGCDEDEVERFMERTFGNPYEKTATRSFWKNSFLWSVAQMPSEPGRCAIHFLPISEANEIERLKKL